MATIQTLSDSVITRDQITDLRLLGGMEESVQNQIA